jgi:hypothetical protein
MDWLSQDVPPIWQWVAFFATIVGTGMAVWAALSAKAARDQAKEARDAAILLGRVLQLSDLVSGMQELQSMLSRSEFVSVAEKSTHLRGRIVRFKQQAYDALNAETREHLDNVRDQLHQITDAAMHPKTADSTKRDAIQQAFAAANESLNRVFAIHHGESIAGVIP